MENVQYINIEALLSEASNGSLEAYNKIFPLIYVELRQIAHRIRFQFFGLDTLNTTAIVHEAYLKLVNSNAAWKNKAHFSAVAGKAMRQLLLNAARKRKAYKRGGESKVVPFEEWEDQICLSDNCSNELIELDSALKQLGEKDQQQLKLVECRFFANMTIEETAEALDLSASTVKRSWHVARSWLYSQIQQQKIA